MDDVDTDNYCVATGLIVRNGMDVSVAMEWHMAHKLSIEFQRDFLRLRCRALQEAFGDLKGVRGLVKNVKMNAQGDILTDAKGDPVVFGEKIVHHPKSCKAVMGFVWPNVDDTKWEVLKASFKEIFDPAALHGEACVKESHDGIHIASYFELVERGGD